MYHSIEYKPVLIRLQVRYFYLCTCFESDLFHLIQEEELHGHQLAVVELGLRVWLLGIEEEKAPQVEKHKLPQGVFDVVAPNALALVKLSI